MTDQLPHSPRPREIELELFKRVDARLERIETKMDGMSEKIIRIDAQEIGTKVEDLEKRVRSLEEWKSRVAGQVAVIIVPIAAAVGAVIKTLMDFLARGA